MLRYTAKDKESGQASVENVQAALNRLAELEDWWELFVQDRTPPSLLVRCEDCKYKKPGSNFCEEWCDWTEREGYCFRGEKRCTTSTE